MRSALSVLPIGLLLLQILLASNSIAQQHSTQCVTPKSTPVNNRLVFVGPNVFLKPGDATPLLVLRMNVPLWAVSKRGKWLLLTGTSNSQPFQENSKIGWALEAELDYQGLRNCN